MVKQLIGIIVATVIIAITVAIFITMDIIGPIGITTLIITPIITNALIMGIIGHDMDIGHIVSRFILVPFIMVIKRGVRG